MAIARKTADQYERHRNCEKCDAGFEDLKLSGKGDWNNRIMCNKCGHYWTASYSALAQLLYEQYPAISSPARARELMRQTQAEYEAEIARQRGF